MLQVVEGWIIVLIQWISGYRQQKRFGLNYDCCKKKNQPFYSIVLLKMIENTTLVIHTSVHFYSSIWFTINKHRVLDTTYTCLYPFSPFIKVVFLLQHEIYEAPIDLIKSLFNVKFKDKPFVFACFPKVYSLIYHNDDICNLSSFNKGSLICWYGE